MLKKILVISICFSVSFVIVMLFLSHRKIQETEELKVEPAADEIADVVGQSQRFEQNENPPPSKVDGNQENSDTTSTDATHFEVTTPDVESSNEASDSVSEAKDEEFEAQWKEVEELLEDYFGKDIDELAEEHLANLRLRVDESLAQIEPLFEDLTFYEDQLKELKRQEELQRKMGLAEDEFERQKNMADQSVAWRDYCQVEGKLYDSYVFLSHFLSSEDGINQFGHLYMSTPEYAKLKTFSEDYYARQEIGIIYPPSLSDMFLK